MHEEDQLIMTPPPSVYRTEKVVPEYSAEDISRLNPSSREGFGVRAKDLNRYEEINVGNLLESPRQMTQEDAERAAEQAARQEQCAFTASTQTMTEPFLGSNHQPDSSVPAEWSQVKAETLKKVKKEEATNIETEGTPIWIWVMVGIVIVGLTAALISVILVKYKPFNRSTVQAKTGPNEAPTNPGAETITI